MSGPILPIQYLRALAALMVVWHHARDESPWLHAMFPADLGTFGVDLFFVISGFIMVVTTHGRAITPWQFMRRRILRVVPLYWFLTLALVGVSLAAPALLRSAEPEPLHVLLSLLFVPHASPSFPETLWPFLVPGWTLNYEMAFYALFALTLGRTWLLVALLGALFTLGLAIDGGAVWQFYTHYMVLEFAAGALLALGWLRAGAPRPAWARVELPVLRALGDASYAIYLTHLFTLGLLRSVWHPTPGLAAGIGMMATSLAACAGVGWLVHRWVEVPLLDPLRRRGRASTPLALAR